MLNDKEIGTKKSNSRSQWIAGAVVALGVALGTASVQAQTTYNIAGLADFTGPYADIMKDWTNSRKAVIEWWNAEVGKGLGITLNIKDYDHRYDVARIASLWPGIKSELNPIVALGVGGPDVAALQQRLPTDKVPMIMSTASYGYVWKPDPWIFNPRPTYSHEAVAFAEWYRKKRGGDAPVKLGIISSEASPAYIDLAKGIEKYAKDNPKTVEVVETIYTEVQPRDLTSQVSRLVRKGVEVIQIQTNTAVVVAVRRALQSLGKTNIPIMMSSHNGLVPSGKALGGMDQLEGNYEAYGMAIPTDDMTDARAFFDKLRAKYKLDANYNVSSLMGMDETLVAVRAIENAAKASGASKIDGEAVRKALLSTPISSAQTFGVLPNLKWTADAPFPTSGMTLNIGTVEKGKYKIAAEHVPVPVLSKW